MSKKIQVSTVKQTADVQVLFINASLITKVLRASIATKNILDKMCEYGNAIAPIIKMGDEGEEVLDENGKPIQELDENGKPMFNYSYFRMDATFVEQFHTQIAPFLKELVDAFDEAE